LKIEMIITTGVNEGIKWNLSEKNWVRGGGEKLEKNVLEQLFQFSYII